MNCSTIGQQLHWLLKRRLSNSSWLTALRIQRASSKSSKSSVRRERRSWMMARNARTIFNSRRRLRKSQPLPHAVRDRPASESARLSSLFPQGDPAAPFSMSDFLTQSTEPPDVETAAQRHAAIAELVQSSIQPSRTNVSHAISPSEIAEIKF